MQEWWEETSTTILRVGQDVLSIPAGQRSSGDKETWWWNDKVQDVIKAKKEARKMWETAGRQRLLQAGTQGGKESNSTAKARAMNELYEELETPEGERNISRIAKAIDFNQTKDEQRVVLRDLGRIMGRWKGYFDKLLNGEGRNVGYNEETRKRIEVTDMRMLRWMCGVTRNGKIRNEHIRGTTRVAQASKKISERILNWHGHVIRRDGEDIPRKVLRADIPGKRKRGRPKTRWKDACQRDLKSTGLRAGEETDREMWRRKIISYTGDST